MVLYIHLYTHLLLSAKCRPDAAIRVGVGDKVSQTINATL
jgi:hypothetical protein